MMIAKNTIASVSLIVRNISIIVLSLQKYGVYGNFLYMDYVCFYRFYRKNLFPVLFLFFLRIMGGMTDSSSPPNPFQRAAKNSLFFGSSTQAEARGQAEVRE